MCTSRTPKMAEALAGLTSSATVAKGKCPCCRASWLSFERESRRSAKVGQELRFTLMAASEPEEEESGRVGEKEREKRKREELRDKEQGRGNWRVKIKPFSVVKHAAENQTLRDKEEGRGN